MASRLSKLRQRILVSSLAVFILVSVSSSSAAQTRCYWCGPLAEQVHRSQRAPSCDSFHLDPHETECDPGYEHCAIVATAPPYAESRLCVKFYQDECYSLYCNSTKTWRMVCACQGNLCNGAHTDRETEAFALVPKFAKNKPRNKRTAANFISVKTKHSVDENTVIVVGKMPNETQPNDLSLKAESVEQNTSPTDEKIIIQMTPTPKKADDIYTIVHGAFTNVDKNTDVSKPESHISKKDMEPTMPNMKDKVETTKVVDTNMETTKMDGQNDNTMNTASNTKLNASEASKGQESKKVDNQNKSPETNNENTEIIKNNTEMDKPAPIATISPKHMKENHARTTMKPTTIEISVEIQTSVTPGKMPPAENLQQNTTPTKALEVTTMRTMATTDNYIETTLPEHNNNTQNKNGTTLNLAQALVFLVCFFAHWCQF